MHFKNNRPAKDGDPVICRGYNGEITVGKIHSIVPGSESCNCTIAEVVMGGTQQLTCRTVGELYHAEDAFAAIESVINPPAAVTESPVEAAP